MGTLRIFGGAVALAMATLGSSPTLAQGAEPAETTTKAPQPERPFIPGDFNPPALVDAGGFKLVPLGPDLVDVDFEAYMSSIEHLQKTFSRSTAWPHKDISAADAMRDMESEQARFRKRQSFAYAVLTPDGTRERGSVYVSPSSVEPYDAAVRMWVTKADHDAGFDAELYGWVSNWVRREWPFRNVVFPGRSVDWETWDRLVAAKGG